MKRVENMTVYEVINRKEFKKALATELDYIVQKHKLSNGKKLTTEMFKRLYNRGIFADPIKFTQEYERSLDKYSTMAAIERPVLLEIGNLVFKKVVASYIRKQTPIFHKVFGILKTFVNQKLGSLKIKIN